MTPETPHKLGWEYRDRVTGFKGIAVARTEWLNGCARITLQPPADKDGKVPDANSFDVMQLEYVGKGYLQDEPPSKTGGPRPDPQRQKDPT